MDQGRRQFKISGCQPVLKVVLLGAGRVLEFQAAGRLGAVTCLQLTWLKSCGVSLKLANPLVQPGQGCGGDRVQGG
jgi:hypothetical protein